MTFKYSNEASKDEVVGGLCLHFAHKEAASVRNPAGLGSDRLTAGPGQSKGPENEELSRKTSTEQSSSNTKMPWPQGVWFSDIHWCFVTRVTVLICGRESSGRRAGWWENANLLHLPSRCPCHSPTSPRAQRGGWGLGEGSGREGNPLLSPHYFSNGIENNWEGKGDTSCQPGERRLGITSLDGVPGSVLGIYHVSCVTAHMSSHQMRAPGWNRDRHPDSQAACLLTVAPGLISECSLVIATSQTDSDTFIFLELNGSATFLTDMFLVNKVGNLSRKNIPSPPPPSPMALSEAIFILDGGKCSW